MEYEVVSHHHLPGIRVFVVEIMTRTAHTHREYELCLLLRGGLQADSGGQTARLAPGQLVLFSPRQPHALRDQGDGALLLILQASPQFCAAYFPQMAQARFETISGFACEAALRAQLIDLGRCCFARPAGYEFAAMACVNRIFALLFGQLPWHTEPQPIDRGAARVARAAAQIEARYAEPLRLRELAEAEGVSPDYLSHAFRKHLGMTFQAYLSQVRLEHAMALVEKTTLSVADICAACGYSSPRYLTADFRRRLGCTPAAYRANTDRRPAAQSPPRGGHPAAVLYPRGVPAGPGGVRAGRGRMIRMNRRPPRLGRSLLCMGPEGGGTIHPTWAVSVQEPSQSASLTAPTIDLIFSWGEPGTLGHVVPFNHRRWYRSVCCPLSREATPRASSPKGGAKPL